MADEEKAPQAQGAEAGAEQQQNATAEQPEAGGGSGGDEVLQLTRTELRSMLDREISKALRTRTTNLEREKAQLLEEIEQLRARTNEAGLDVEGKLRAREKELQQITGELKNLRRAQDDLMREIADLVEAELESLTPEDRMLVDGMFSDDTMSPVVRLRILRALRNAGKLKDGRDEESQRTVRTVGNIGGPMRPTGAGEKPAPANDNVWRRLMETGKKLAQKRTEPAYVPPQWAEKR